MKRPLGWTLIATQLLLWWFAGAQMETSSGAQEDLRAGSDERGPVIAVSPSVLDFKLVGVGRDSDLTLTVKNVGGGILKGRATVPGPFSIKGGTYALTSGESKSLTVRYRPQAPGTNTVALVLAGGSEATVPVTGWARTPPSAPRNLRVAGKTLPRFREEEQADFVVRYFSDETSYMVKPPKVEILRDQRFIVACERRLALNLAAQQPRHDLAVVVLVYYTDAASEERVKLGWANDLRGLRYTRLVFLRGNGRMQVNGLPVVADIRLEVAPVSAGPQTTALSVKK